MSLITILPSTAASGGAFQVPDLLNLPDQRVAVLAEAEGTYGDVYIGSAAAANFICRVQHRLNGATPYAAVIGPFYASRLGAYDSSVIDLTSAAELEVVTGALATYSGGLVTAGDYEFIYHFLGEDITNPWPTLQMQALISDAVGTPANNSFFGCGVIDSAAKGTNRIFGGASYYLASLDWNTACMSSFVTTRTSVAYNVWNPATMPATPSRVTVSAEPVWKTNRVDVGIATTTTDHGGGGAFSTRAFALESVAVPTTATLFGSGVFTGASTTIDSVIEVLCTPKKLLIPAAGY